MLSLFGREGVGIMVLRPALARAGEWEQSNDTEKEEKEISGAPCNQMDMARIVEWVLVNR